MPELLLAIHKFSELNIFANNAKIRPSLKCLLIRYHGWFFKNIYIINFVNIDYTMAILHRGFDVS